MPLNFWLLYDIEYIAFLFYKLKTSILYCTFINHYNKFVCFLAIMQQRYLGDVHDYFKFLFLKYLSLQLNIKIGLNWYLVDPEAISKNEIIKNDGEKRNFLKKPCFSEYDQKIIDEFKSLKEMKNRKIISFTKNSHLKSFIKFYNNFLEYNNRRLWFNESLAYLKKEKIIFLDPDNGFKEKLNGRKSVKYVLARECQELLMRNKIVIFTQFQSFNKHHLKYLNEIFKNLIKYNINPIFPIIRNRTAPNTFYITLAPKNNKIDIASLYESYANNISDVQLIRGF